MKRLIKKSNQGNEQNNIKNINEENNNDIPNVDVEMMQHLRNEVRKEIEETNITNMILLNQLDEADVRHDKCPQCKYEPLKRKEGFKICPACGMIYKVLDGKGYLVVG